MNLKSVFFLTALGLVSAATPSRIVARKDDAPPPCAFSLSASGPFDGSLWQFPDGQIRVNGSRVKSTFWIDNEGGIKDVRGFGCFITGMSSFTSEHKVGLLSHATDLPATQVRCAQRRSPLKGFSIDAENNLKYKNNTKFFACPGLYGEYSLTYKSYLNPEKCLPITLKASDCGNPCPAASTIWETCVSTTTTTTTFTNTEVKTTQDCKAKSFTTSWRESPTFGNVTTPTPVM